MNLDEEAERLLQLHPAVRAGVQPEYHDTHWLPQHAVPRRPKVEWPKPDDAWIDRRVEADLANIDAELDSRQHVTPAPKWTHRTYGKSFFLVASGKDAYIQFDGLSFHYLIKGNINELPRRPPKQPKPKTYVAPGRKAGRTWITRLEQSKQARAKR